MKPISWSQLDGFRFAQPILQYDIEAQRLCEQPLPVIEAMGERVIEPGVEHELLAAERAAFLFQFVQKLLAIAAAALGLIGNEIVDIEEFAVNQVLGNPIAGQSARSGIRPLLQSQRQNAIAVRRLAAPTGDEVLDRGEMRPQLPHQVIAGADLRLADGAETQCVSGHCA